jgi:hypothetical protein
MHVRSIYACVQYIAVTLTAKLPDGLYDGHVLDLVASALLDPALDNAAAAALLHEVAGSLWGARR